MLDVVVVPVVVVVAVVVVDSVVVGHGVVVGSTTKNLHCRIYIVNTILASSRLNVTVT